MTIKEEVVAPIVASSLPPQAIKKSGLVYLSTQSPIVDGAVIAADISSQIEQIFANFRFIIEASNGSLEQVVKVTIYLTNLAALAQVSEKMKLFFPRPYPACTIIQTSALMDEGQIAIEGVADLNE